MVTEPLFSITATSPVLNDSMMLEEEILFACRPEEEVVEEASRVELPCADMPGLSLMSKEQLQAEDEVHENVFNLDTFLPIAAAMQPVSTRDLDLLDLVGHLESRLLASLQGIVGLDLHEVVGSLVKEELEDLRRLIDHIDATDEFRL